MDDKIRQLQREAESSQDPNQMMLLCAQLIRTGQDSLIEMRARTGDWDAIRLFLYICHYEKSVDLNNLWICPMHIISPYEFVPGAVDTFPYHTPFFPSLPYKIGMTLKDLANYYEDRWDYTPNTIVGAIIVDVADLELADSVTYDLEARLQGEITPEEELPNYVWLTKLEILTRNAILYMNEKGQFSLSPPSFASYQIIGSRYRQTHGYIEDEHRHDLYQDPGNMEKYWPKRRTKPRLSYMPSSRATSRGYVVIVHEPSLSGYILAGDYSYLRDATPDDIFFAMRYYTQRQAGWVSTHSRPEWAAVLPAEEFVAYWVAS